MSAGPPRDAITGLVLAGGQGRRMGGADKGLLPFAGTTLAAHALARLRPQVGPLLISANRHAGHYAALGVPVVADADPSFAGPLAGVLAALEQARTPWLACVPCDSPAFPLDLVPRLAAAADGAEIACPVSGPAARLQPVFLLVHAALREPLRTWLAAGGRRVEAFIDTRRAVRVPFDDEAAFANANTPDELQALDGRDG